MVCPGYPDPQFLFFSSQVPPLLYYSHIPTAAIALLFGLFVYMKNRSSLSGRILFLIALVFFAWALCDLITWTSNDSDVIVFFWSLFGLLYALLSLFSVYFASVFIEGRDMSLKEKVALGVLLLPILVLTPTRFNIETFDLLACGIPREGAYFTGYYYGIGFLAFFWILFMILRRLRRKDIPWISRLPTLYMGIGIEFFLMSFFLSGFLASILVDYGYIEDYSLADYGLFGMPVFIGLLAYLIVRYRAFNIKLIATQALVVALAVLIGAQLFFIKTTINYVLTSITFLLSVGFGIALIRSVRDEVKRKEELQALSNKLAEANAELKRLDRSKTEFISIASHQLRTPLTAIKGFVSLLLEGAYGKVPQETKEVLSKISVANERIIQLVEDLLNISRMETGRLQYEYAEVDIVPLLGELRDAFSVSAKKRGLSLIFDEYCGDVPLLVWIDRRKSFEVISNLIDNAIKYTPSGSVHVQAEKTGDFVRISVRDTGLGISQDTMAHLFLKFSRGEGGRKMFANGTGLGLYVGKNLVEAQGGRIWAESEGPGKGSTFFVEFPMKQKREFSGEQRVKTSLKGSEHE